MYVDHTGVTHVQIYVRAHPGHSLGLGCVSHIIDTRQTGSLQRFCRTSVAMQFRAADLVLYVLSLVTVVYETAGKRLQ
jgi:hypothetical protein